MENKPLLWLHGEVKTPPFSEEARYHIGYFLRQLQKGFILEMPHSRPMPSIGIRCHELRVSDSKMRKIWRLVYRVDAEAIVVVDVFQKSTQTTPKTVIDNCKRRLRQFDG